MVSSDRVSHLKSVTRWVQLIQGMVGCRTSILGVDGDRHQKARRSRVDRAKTPEQRFSNLGAVYTEIRILPCTYICYACTSVAHV